MQNAYSIEITGSVVLTKVWKVELELLEVNPYF